MKMIKQNRSECGERKRMKGETANEEFASMVAARQQRHRRQKCRRLKFSHFLWCALCVHGLFSDEWWMAHCFLNCLEHKCVYVIPKNKNKKIIIFFCWVQKIISASRRISNEFFPKTMYYMPLYIVQFTTVSMMDTCSARTSHIHTHNNNSNEKHRNEIRTRNILILWATNIKIAEQREWAQSATLKIQMMCAWAVCFLSFRWKETRRCLRWECE